MLVNILFYLSLGQNLMLKILHFFIFILYVYIPFFSSFSFHAISFSHIHFLFFRFLFSCSLFFFLFFLLVLDDRKANMNKQEKMYIHHTHTVYLQRLGCECVFLYGKYINLLFVSLKHRHIFTLSFFF